MILSLNNFNTDSDDLAAKKVKSTVEFSNTGNYVQIKF